MKKEAPSMTVRVTQAIIDYRDTVCGRTGRIKSHFDKEVYEYYIAHHPIDEPTNEQKEAHG